MIPQGMSNLATVVVAGLFVVFVPPTGVVRAQQPIDNQQIIQRVTRSIDRSLEYLAKRQESDGSWESGFGKNNGINGVALLAFMGRGHDPRRGPYRETLEQGRRFVLATQRQDGMFQSPRPSHGPMYEQALATLAMIEMLGMTDDPTLEPKVRKAVDRIVKAQAPEGGWRYQPDSKDADISVTVMEIVALRAAQNAGMDVPQETMKKAIAYVERCAVAEGGFAYQPGQGPGAARTAAGILSLQLAGKPDSPSVKKAITYLGKQKLVWGGEHFYYLHYYAMQAQFQAGGNDWNSWNPVVREMLLKNQNADGSWGEPPNNNEGHVIGRDKVYSTAMACLALEIYLHFLPAYQR